MKTLPRSVRIVLLPVLLLLPAPASAGPWTKDLGQFYLKLGESLFFADAYRGADGQLVEGETTYLGVSTSLYYEVGVYKGLHLWGYLPYLVAQNNFQKSGRSTLNASGGDALLGVQYSPPFTLLFPAALKLEIKVPLYEVAEIPIGFAAPGDGQLDFAFFVSAGGSLGKVPLFFYGELGYRLRSDVFVGQSSGASFGDGLAYFASVGYTLWERLTVSLNSGGSLPFDSGQATKGYVTLGPAVYVVLWRGLAAEASFDPMIYTNQNASPGFGFSLGVSYKN